MNAIFAGLALTLTAPALKGPVKGEPPPILGQWALTEWLQSGQVVGFTEGSSVEFLADGKRIWRDGAGAAGDHRGYKLIPKTDPPAINLIRPSPGQEPETFFGIYKVEGDTLIIAVSNQGMERPKNFDNEKEVIWQRMTYKRMKKE